MLARSSSKTFMVQLYSKLRIVSIKVHVDSAYERPQHRNSFDTSMIARKPLEKVIGTIFLLHTPKSPALTTPVMQMSVPSGCISPRATQ